MDLFISGVTLRPMEDITILFLVWKVCWQLQFLSVFVYVEKYSFPLGDCFLDVRILLSVFCWGFFLFVSFLLAASNLIPLPLAFILKLFCWEVSCDLASISSCQFKSTTETHMNYFSLLFNFAISIWIFLITSISLLIIAIWSPNAIILSFTF